MIPPIITQTWRDTDLPPRAMAFRESWKRLNPGFEYRFHDDAACRELIRATVPQYLDAYTAFPHPVMRADFFRYAALYRHGGIYADIDMECVRPFAPLLELAPVVLGIEAHLTKARQLELGYARPIQIANCIMLAEPGNRLFLDAMRRCVNRWGGRQAVPVPEIEDITGPRMLTRLVEAMAADDIAVLRQTVLAPPRHYPDVWPINANIHARHHFFGTWKDAARKSLSRRWIERDRWPNPFGSRLLSEPLSSPALRNARS